MNLDRNINFIKLPKTNFSSKFCAYLLYFYVFHLYKNESRILKIFHAMQKLAIPVYIRNCIFIFGISIIKRL